MSLLDEDIGSHTIHVLDYDIQIEDLAGTGNKARYLRIWDKNGELVDDCFLPKDLVEELGRMIAIGQEWLAEYQRK